MRWKPFLFVAGMLLAGCARHDRGRERVREVEKQRRELADEWDQIEARLLVMQARVRYWKELRERHQEVTEFACTNLDAHARDIARFEREQEQKVAAKQRRSRVASTFVPHAGRE